MEEKEVMEVKEVSGSEGKLTRFAREVNGQ